MENARIFLVEDHDNLRLVMRSVLEHEGHKVIAEASSKVEASQTISRMASEVVDLVVVEEDLSEGIINEIRLFLPGVRIMLIANGEEGEGGPSKEVDHTIIKGTAEQFDSMKKYINGL